MQFVIWSELRIYDFKLTLVLCVNAGRLKHPAHIIYNGYGELYLWFRNQL